MLEPSGANPLRLAGGAPNQARVSAVEGIRPHEPAAGPYRELIELIIIVCNIYSWIEI